MCRRILKLPHRILGTDIRCIMVKRYGKLKIFLIHTTAILPVIATMVMGGFAAAGVCAFIWGPEILNTHLGKPPDWGHAASWTFLFLMIPFMIIGFVGGLFLFAIPLYTYFNLPMAVKPSMHASDIKIMKRYFRVLSKFYVINFQDGFEKTLSEKQSDDT